MRAESHLSTLRCTAGGGVVGKEPLERFSPKKVPPSLEDYGVIEFLSGVQAVSLGKWGNAG